MTLFTRRAHPPLFQHQQHQQQQKQHNHQPRLSLATAVLAAVILVLQMASLSSHSELNHRDHDEGDSGGFACHYCLVMDAQAELGKPKLQAYFTHPVYHARPLQAASAALPAPRFTTAQSRAPPTA